MIDAHWVAGGSTAAPVRVEHDQWLDEPAAAPLTRGLARNPAAPAEVLLRLLDTHEAAAANPALPVEVMESLAARGGATLRTATGHRPQSEGFDTV